MKKISLLLAMAIVIVSCSKTQKETILTYPDGKPQLVYEVQTVNGNKQRVAEEMFYESGNIRYKKGFKNEKPNGVWEFYYENGKIFAQADFSESEKGSQWEFYTQKGDRIFQKSDNITILEIMPDKSPVSVEGGDDFRKIQYQFYANFAVRSIGNMKNNLRDGKWTFYFENGNIQTEGNFVNGIQEGEQIVYHENGSPYYKGSYKNGKRAGVWQFFDENGKLASEKTF